MSILSSIVEYRRLFISSMVGPAALVDGDRQRLGDLDAELRSITPTGEPRRFARFAWNVGATLHGWAGDGNAELLDISAGGLRLRSETRVEPGELATIEVFVAPTMRYVLPVRVAWVAAPGSGLVGASFVGVPRVYFDRLGSNPGTGGHVDDQEPAAATVLAPAPALADPAPDAPAPAPAPPAVTRPEAS